MNRLQRRLHVLEKHLSTTCIDTRPPMDSALVRRASAYYAAFLEARLPCSGIDNDMHPVIDDICACWQELRGRCHLADIPYAGTLYSFCLAFDSILEKLQNAHLPPEELHFTQTLEWSWENVVAGRCTAPFRDAWDAWALILEEGLS